MAEHYYTSKPSVEHDLHRIEETLRGHKFVFMTDAGVFSKKKVSISDRSFSWRRLN